VSKRQIVLISILAIVVLIGCFIYWLDYIKQPAESGTLKTGEIDLCAEFSQIQDTVKCETARATVLEKYPGEIKYIKRTKAELIAGMLPDVKKEKKEVWLFGINLKIPIEMDERELKSMEIFVTRDGGELEMPKLMSGKL